MRRSWSISLLLALVLLIGNKARAEAVTPIDVAKAAIRANFLFAEKLHTSVMESDMLISGDSIFFNLQGTHYLYSYHPKRGTFIRLDQSEFHGHNFGRYLFMYKGEIYAFGGYGFWQSHSRLIKFDFTSHEWQLVPLAGVKIPGDPIFNVLNGDTLFVVGVTVKHEIENPKEIRQKAYKIDMAHFRVEEYEFSPKTEFDYPGGLSFTSFNSNYYVQGAPSSVGLIYDYRQKKLYRNLSGPRLFRLPNFKRESYDSVMHFVAGNEVITVLYDKIVERVNIQEYIKYYCVEVDGLTNNIVKPELNKSENNVLYLGIVLIILSIGILLYQFMQGKGPFRKKILNYYMEVNSDTDVLKMLKQIQPDVYTEKEIDIIFRIYHYPNSVRKIKRNQYIFSLNELMTGVVEKLPHPKRKGQFVYRINAIPSA